MTKQRSNKVELRKNQLLTWTNQAVHQEIQTKENVNGFLNTTTMLPKKLFLIIFLLLSLHGVSLAQMKSEVDERFELVSIVFGLAEAPEYSDNPIASYKNDIDNYFSKYKNHKLIDYAKKLRETQYISYDAVAKVASFLDIKRGRVKIKPELEGNLPEKRWTEESLKTFVSLLDNFYRKTKFRDFYLQYSNLYHIAQQRLDSIVSVVNTDYFVSFFGEKFQTPAVIASLCNGPHNYFYKVTDTNFGIVIGSGSDQYGMPIYTTRTKTIIIHEILHKYSNPIIESYWTQLQNAADTIYFKVQNEMKSQAYGSAKTMTREWLVRLFTILFFKENMEPSRSVNSMIASERSLGFIWMRRSVEFMDNFYNNREKYISINEFMPQLVNFFNFTADNLDRVITEHNNRRPYIVETFPVNGSTMNISDIDNVYFRFSEPMNTKSHGIQLVNSPNVDTLKRQMMPYWKDEFTYVYPVDNNKLTNGKTYGISLDSRFFAALKSFFRLEESYTYTIKAK